MNNKTNEPPHERSGHVDGVGMVRVTTAQCTCGRLVQPGDFRVHRRRSVPRRLPGLPPRRVRRRIKAP